jgi:alpha-glucosidase
MAEYTAGRRLHAAYSFHFLRGPWDARFIREAVESFFAHPGAPRPCWSFSNHDVARVVSRWAPRDPALRTRFALLANILLVSLPGTIFLYQGEELGLTQVDVPRERLVDPEGIANWPRHRNRDGARTPMPWKSGAPDLGFGARDPWLPFGPDHAALAVDRAAQDSNSVMNRLREHLAWRRSVPDLGSAVTRFRDAAPGVLAFERAADARRLGFVFNLTEKAQRFSGFAGASWIRGEGGLETREIVLPPLGHAIVEFSG